MGKFYKDLLYSYFTGDNITVVGYPTIDRLNKITIDNLSVVILDNPTEDAIFVNVHLNVLDSDIINISDTYTAPGMVAPSATVGRVILYNTLIADYFEVTGSLVVDGLNLDSLTINTELIGQSFSITSHTECVDLNVSGDLNVDTISVSNFDTSSIKSTSENDAIGISTGGVVDFPNVTDIFVKATAFHLVPSSENNYYLIKYVTDVVRDIRSEWTIEGDYGKFEPTVSGNYFVDLKVTLETNTEGGTFFEDLVICGMCQVSAMFITTSEIALTHLYGEDINDPLSVFFQGIIYCQEGLSYYPVVKKTPNKARNIKGEYLKICKAI